MSKNNLSSRDVLHWAVVLLLGLIAQSLSAATSPTNLPPIVLQTNSTVSQVKFRNGDTLQGGLVAIDAEKQVHWTNSAIRPVMKFPVSDVTKVRLAPSSAPDKARGLGNCVLRLLSGDQFTGNLVAMDDETVLLDTWYAGQMKFPRQQVRWLRSLDAGSYVYQGPTGLDGWTISASVDDDAQPAWGYSRGSFFSRQAGGIGRDLKLPDRSAIDFDVNWEQYLQLTVTIYTESLQVYRLPGVVGGVIVGVGGGVVVQQQNAPAQGTNPQPGAGFYAVHLNGGGAYLMTVRKNGDVSNSPVESIPSLGQSTRAHISLRVDKIEKTISLLIDGKLAKTWKEEGEFAGRGTGVRFVQQGVNAVNLSHISVGPWDGKLETALASLAGDDLLEKTVLPTSGTNDIFQLKNQDSFAGTLDRIRDGSLFVKTSFGSINFPLERVIEIDLATPKAAKAKPEPGSVRAFFADTDGRATFQIVEWDQGKVIATSPIFGRVQFNPAAFSIIDFEPTTRR